MRSRSGKPTRLNAQSKSILQVEDEEADIFLLAHVFKKAGIDSPLHVVTDGQMALDYLSGNEPFADRQKHPLPCLVLLDLKLPKLTGMEVLAWIRQQPSLRNLVVVVFSSSCQPADLEQAYELGANSFLQKPTGLAHSLEVAQLLKGWWLGYNRFAPIYEVSPR
jgi:CheY-like chemotaxis protein